jgi:signal transduction histidine kinase
LASLPALTLAAAGTGGVIRTQRFRSELLARERVSTLQQEWARQRLALARDLHDLVGHGLSTIAVQSSTARLALQADRAGTALAAVTAVEKGSRDTMAGVRELLELLIEDAEEPVDPSRSRRPAPGLSDIAALVAELPDVVSVDLDLQPGLSPAPVVGLCAFRVVQEALTNAVRHAPGAAVRVRVHSQGGALVVEVTDDGAGSGGPGGAGFGLRGMRERLNALGGTLTAGPMTGGGWQLRAELPAGKGLS